MFESTAPFALFDYFRVPHERVDRPRLIAPGLASLSARGQSASLFWPTERCVRDERRRPSATSWARRRSSDESRPIGCAAPGFAASGGTGEARDDIRDADGTSSEPSGRRDDGSTFLPFDPNELMADFWSERYLDYLRPNAAVTHLAGLARRGYYRARPLLPRSVQMSMRRSFSRVQSKSRFPRWPVETALHDFYDFLFATVASVAERPVPYIGAVAPQLGMGSGADSRRRSAESVTRSCPSSFRSRSKPATDPRGTSSRRTATSSPTSSCETLQRARFRGRRARSLSRRP